jgi:CheY-like chemotaxis protein
MDLQLPEMDGYEAANWIRKNFHGPKSNIPIIAVTAHATAEDREKCLEAGMDAYVSKPFDWKKLRVMMATLLNEAKERSMEGEGGMALEGKSS